MSLKGGLLVAVLATAVPGLKAIETVPVFNGSIMGGQYFYKGERSNLNANISALFSPMVKINEDWSFLPIYSGNYQGTKGVGDYVGAGTIFQQEMDQLLSITGIRRFSGSSWRIKPSASFKYEFLKETRDEDWGGGLFDYEKIAAGVELENLYRDPFSYHFSLDYFHIHFPNYQSLESRAGTDPAGNPLSRGGAGKNVLDSDSIEFSAGASRPYPYDDPVISLQGGYSLRYQNYPDQKVVDSRGQFGSSARNDILQTLSGSIGYPRSLTLNGSEARLDSRLTASVSVNESNQNTFDAAETRYINDTYSDYEWGLGPSVRLAWGRMSRPSWASIGFRFARTQYSGRLAQNAGGLYTSEAQYDDRYNLSLAYGYPIAEGFYLKAQSDWFWSRSNQKFEATYPYNYRTESFLIGFSYEY
jgi:hypothetical protein